MAVYVYKYGGQGLDEGEHDLAASKGTKQITAREHDKMLRRLAKERGIKLP